MERLVIVRHGFPDHMVTGQTGGWTDSHLTDLVRRQAGATGRRLAELLANQRYTFWSSDLSRACETAEEIAQALGRSPQLTPALREQDLGQANNLLTSQAERIALPPDHQPLVDHAFFPQAETWRHMMQRVFDFLDDQAGDSNEPALLVSHTGASICIVYWWLGLAPCRWPAVQFGFDLCSISELTVGDFQGRRITRLNDTGHLSGLSDPENTG